MKHKIKVIAYFEGLKEIDNEAETDNWRYACDLTDALIKYYSTFRNYQQTKNKVFEYEITLLGGDDCPFGEKPGSIHEIDTSTGFTELHKLHMNDPVNIPTKAKLVNDFLKDAIIL